jgi:hypothetical protein
VAALTARSSGGPGSVAGSSAPAGSSGGLPAPVAYALVALAGMAVVVGGGWLLLSRQAVR